MQRKIAIKAFTLLFLLFSFVSYANEDVKDASKKGDLKTEIKDYIQHHLKDSHDFSLTSYTKDNGEHVYVGFPLPVILWDGGLKVFSSSKFHHGETLAEVGGNHYKLYHNKIYKTDASGTISYDEEHHPTNAKPLDFSITKNVAVIFLVSILIFFLFKSLAKSYVNNNGIAKGVGRFFEPIILYIRDDIAIPNIGEKKYKKYMPYLLTVFFFVWFINLLGLTPLGVNVTNSISVTVALALITFIITNFTGTKDYWMHIFDPLGDSLPWYGKLFLYPILIPIEVLGIFIKPFSLLIRLYANIKAGHIVMMSLIGLMFLFKSWLGSPLSFGLAFCYKHIFLQCYQRFILVSPRQSTNTMKKRTLINLSLN